MQLDKRILLEPLDWKDYLDDTPGEHEGDPVSYPCYIITAFIGGVFKHEFIGVEELESLRLFKRVSRSLPPRPDETINQIMDAIALDPIRKPVLPKRRDNA